MMFEQSLTRCLGLGANEPLFKEVLRYVLSDTLFQVDEQRLVSLADKYDFVIVRDFDEAEYQNSEAVTVSDHTWQEIRALEQSCAYCIEIDDIYKRIGKKLNDASNVIWSAAVALIPHGQRYPSEHIATDFYYIAQTRVYYETNNKFHEMLFDFYRAGTWPCGWQGSYPEGKLIVYVSDYLARLKQSQFWYVSVSDQSARVRCGKALRDIFHIPLELAQKSMSCIPGTFFWGFEKDALALKAKLNENGIECTLEKDPEVYDSQKEDRLNSSILRWR